MKFPSPTRSTCFAFRNRANSPGSESGGLGRERVRLHAFSGGLAEQHTERLVRANCGSLRDSGDAELRQTSGVELLFFVAVVVILLTLVAVLTTVTLLVE